MQVEPCALCGAPTFAEDHLCRLCRLDELIRRALRHLRAPPKLEVVPPTPPVGLQNRDPQAAEDSEP